MNTTTLPFYVQALLKPENYPDNTGKVELLQTQMSFIFLTDEYTYKTKKPVNLGYLDYTTIEKRKYFCEQELELNRRLCPGAYLAVVPISNLNGVIKIGETANIIEYSLKMKKLPRDRMMDILLPKGDVTKEMLANVAAKMVDFHSKAATNSTISSYGRPEALKINTDENFSQTEKYMGELISGRSYRLIKNFTDSFMQDKVDLFNQRADGGKIRDCHGDLHAAHVCFADDIYIYDCIEFNDRFRYCDVASEIAFLAMDLDRYARADLSQSFVQTYINASGDKDMAELMDFYKCYRAYVRGKVACFKYDDPLLKDKAAILNEAKLYFNLAYKYANSKPIMIIVTGLIGTGKTTLAEQAGRGLGYEVLSSDVIRKQLAGVPLTQHKYEDFSGGIYSPEFTRKTYVEFFSRAKTLITQGQSVILDASFKKKADRLDAFALAQEMGAGFLAIECKADDQTIKERLEKRKKEISPSDGRWEIFQDIKKDFDAVTELPDNNLLSLDTAQLSSNTISSILEKMTWL